MDFKGKTVMITGAVRNTGLVIAHEFAAAGARVIVNGRKADDVERVSAELKEKYGCVTIDAVLDIADDKAVDEYFDKLESEGVVVDVLINNAVVQVQGYNFIDTPYDELLAGFKINSIGLYHVSQRVAKIMRANGGGSIVNIGSNTAIRPVKNRTAYVASKGAVDALTRAMAIDLAEFNIRVNTVVAGYIHSDRWLTLPQGSIDRRHKNIPLGKECAPEDIARGAMFIASDLSPRTTGSSLVIDGGCSTQLIPNDCDV